MPVKPRLCLSDACWHRIANKIPDLRRCGGVSDRDTRRFIEAVFWIWRTGAPWRDLPGYFGRWFTAYKRFRRWAGSRVWQVVHTQLLPVNSSATDTVSIDSTSIRAHQHAAGGWGGAKRNEIGRSRGGRTTKVHATVCNDKMLLAQILTVGERADITQAMGLIKRVLRLHPARVIADKAYDADTFVASLAKEGIEAVIPPRKHRRNSRCCPRDSYRKRNVVERFYAHAKQFRRLATRFEKTAASYRAGLLLVSVRYLVA